MITRRLLMGCAFFAMMSLGAVASEAQGTLDQSFTTPTNVSAAINECCRFAAQTFTAGRTGTLTGIAIDVLSEPPKPFPLHIAIRDVNGNNPGTTILGETTLSTSGTSLSQIISFPQPIAIVARSRYAIVVDYPDAPPPGAGQNQGQWGGAYGNQYSGGEALSNRENGTLWQRTRPGVDLHFQTYVSP